MQEVKVFLDENKIYKEILKECIKKYKSLGKISGSFKFKANNESDKNFLKAFDISVLNTGIAKIKVNDVEKLFKNRFNEYEFLNLLEYVEGKKLITNAEKRALKQDDFNSFLDEICSKSNLGRGLTWFCDCVDKKDKVFKYLSSSYAKRDKVELMKIIMIIIEMLNNLPSYNDEYLRIPVFSGVYSKDTHFLDLKNFSGNLFLKVLIDLYNENEELSKGTIFINEIYLKAGLLKDDISNNTVTYGLIGVRDENEIQAWKSFIDIKNPLVLTLKNLENIDYIRPISKDIFIFENPAVFSDIIDYGITNKALICTSGQLNLSSHIILEKLAMYEKIYYAGDFDIKGIEIAFNLKIKLKDKVEFLFYDKQHYKKTISDINLDENKLKHLEKYRCGELDEVINCMMEEGKAGYQELLIKDYCSMMKL